jgi:hypothetical protein
MAIKYSTYDADSGNSFSLNTITGQSGTFTTQISGNLYKASGDITVISDSGDVRPYGLFSFPTSVGSSGQVLTTQGDGLTTWIAAAGGASGTFNEYSGNSTWIKPSGCTFVYVEAWGAGGGGGNGPIISSSTQAYAGGGGGGGGAYSAALFNAASISSSVTVTIGAGGIGGSITSSSITTGGFGALGGFGGNSSFGTYITGYGGGGGGSLNNFPAAIGGGGGGAGLNGSPPSRENISGGAPYESANNTAASGFGRRIYGGGPGTGLLANSGVYCFEAVEAQGSVYGGGGGAGSISGVDGRIAAGDYNLLRKRQFIPGLSNYGGIGGGNGSPFVQRNGQVSMTGVLTLTGSGVGGRQAFGGATDYFVGFSPKGVIFADDKFVGWSDSTSSYILTSTGSGINWIATKTDIGGPDIGIQQILYAQNTWIACLAGPVVLETGTKYVNFPVANTQAADRPILVSTNLSSWVVTGSLNIQTTENNSLYIKKIATDNSGNYVAIDNRGEIFKSSNLQTWTYVTGAANSAILNDLIYDPNSTRYTTVGTNRTIMYSSDSGNTWTSGTYIGTGTVTGIGTTFTAVASNGSGIMIAKPSRTTPGYIRSSDSGTTWSGGGQILAQSGEGALIYAPVSGIFLLFSSGNSNYRTTDGLTWSTGVNPTRSIVQSAAVNASGTVYAAANADTLTGDSSFTDPFYTSTNTSTWTARTATSITSSGKSGETPTGFANGGGGGGCGTTTGIGGNGAPGLIRVYSW